MPGKIILAGGNEMRPGCEEMDERVLRDAGGRQHQRRPVGQERRVRT